MLTRFSVLFHLTPLIINKQGKTWLSLYLLDGLTDIQKIFTIMSVVTGVGGRVTVITTLFHGGLILSRSHLCKSVVFQ